MSGGLGFLIGMTMGGSSDAAAGAVMADDLARMREQLSKKLQDATVQEALKVAAAEVHAELVEEMRDASKGRVSSLRLADPENQEGRNARFAERVKSAALRISGGSIKLDQAAVDNVRKARTLK